jgi:sulfate transport system substrate-binding protein
MRATPRGTALLAAFAGVLLAGCGTGEGRESGAASGGAPRQRTLTLGAYTTPREAYGRRIIPAFQRHWKERTGEEVRFEESYLGSGAQARAIAEGFEADVAALSLEPDLGTLEDAGLVTHDWRKAPNAGIVTRSIVVIGVRPGNPEAVHDWADLRRVSVLTPSPRTSGGAMWNVAAVYGAALRGGTPAARGDGAAAEAFLGEVLGRVRVMDRGARESMITFEQGVGDAVVTYENEALVARQAGEAMEYVIPRSTILIENPVAVVDRWAAKHGNRDLAEAFVAFLATPEAQRMYAEYGLRPVDASVAVETAARFPAVEDLFTIRDLGGWPVARREIFAEGGVFDRAQARLARAR